MKGILIVVAAVLGLGIVIGAGSFVGVYNTCVEQETSIGAQYKQNQNNYDNFFKSVMETAQVATKYSADLKKVFDRAMTGRYGANGSKATWAWIQEHNPTLDVNVYTKIQQIIESGRANFETNQKLLIDKKAVYNLTLTRFPTNLVAGAMGFPKIDLTKMDIVTSDDTQKAFDTKKADAIKI